MKDKHVQRLLKLPERSFFLFGPRGVGKTTLLKDLLPGAPFFNLLDYSLHLELTREQKRLEAMTGNLPEKSWVIIDEIQKLPRLLDEVHRLIEERNWRFALSGSSARKLRKGGVNLLGGRALTRELAPFSSKELEESFDLEFSIQWGMMPWIQLDREKAADVLNSYVNTYIKEEIKEEGLVRNLQPFLRFLGVAGQLNGQQVNALNIAREAAVPRSTVDVYFSILQDTLLGHFLPPYRPHLKVREQSHSKFYWFDPGVARAAAGLLFDKPDRLWMGTALETLIFHELRVYNQISGANRPIYYYRTAGGTEIDFVIETAKRQASSKARIVCIEVKTAQKWDRKWEKPMRSIKSQEGPEVERMLGVYMGSRAYHFDGIDIMPVTQFLSSLYEGRIF